MSEFAPILTPRLKLIADLIHPCRCVADIGTDHAYLPVWLCAKGICKRAIASDIRKGPLMRAAATLRQYGKEDVIETRLGGGADTLMPNDADCIVIAGMGGLMIGQILADHPEIFAETKQILLQPMTAVYELRAFLYQNGYTILQERLAREEEKLYHVLSVTKAPETTPPTEEELYFGKDFMAQTPEHFDFYLAKQQKKLSRMAAGLKHAQSKDAAEKLTKTQALLHAVEALIRKREETPCEN